MTLRRTRYIILCAALLCALALVFALLCERKAIPAQAEGAVAKVGETNYENFFEALSAWHEGDTLHLLSDCGVPEGVQTIKVGEKKTLDLMGFTLSGGSLRTLWVEEGGSLTIRDSASTGKITGGGIRVEGELILTGGCVTQNTVADDGGGVYVLAGGKFTMTGGKITGNTAAGRGGGVFSDGETVLGGSATITENIGKGVASNLYLPAGNFVTLNEDFAGSVGVAVSTAEGTISESYRGGLFADDALYETRETENRLEIRLSPLTTVTAEYAGEERLFPTTGLDRLFEKLALSYSNGNGVPYPEDKVRSLRLGVVMGEERGREFSVGENTVEAEVTGRDGETATVTFTVNVEAPALLKAEVSYTQNRIFRFDSEFSIEDFREDLFVRGYYEDNRERQIFPTAEETAEHNGGYIRDSYSLQGSFSEVSGGKALLKVAVPQGEGACECEFYVDITRYTLYTSEISVRQVKILEGDGTRVTAADFVPELPRGAVASVSMQDGNELDSSVLSSGIYRVLIGFTSENEENFEIMGPKKEARLLVYAPCYEGTAGGMSFVVTCEGGVSPEWSFTVKRTQPKIYLDSGLSAGNIFELTFFPWDSEDIPEEFTVEFTPETQIAKKDGLALFRVNADGSTEQLSAIRDDGTIKFQTNSLNETTFVIAVGNNDRLLVILSVCFAVLCLVCAGALVVYLYLKKRKSKRS